jgi:peptidoglycan/LPS O-acetylase OafA/YrhL
VTQPEQQQQADGSTPDSVRLLRPFSRITTPGRRFIPQIDGLRFIAIMAVIAYHVRGVCLFHFGVSSTGSVAADGVVNRVFESGHYGVQLFFAISGFILLLPFVRQSISQERPVSLREYYLRRLTRIEPPYLIHLVFLLALCALFYRRLPSHEHLYHNPDWAGYAARHILSSAIYANGFIFGAHPYPNYVLWSLEVEVQFYLLAPYLARIFFLSGTISRRVLLIATIAALSLTFWLFDPPYRVWASLAGNLQYFLVGFLLADIYASRSGDDLVRSYRWDFAFLLSCAAVVMGEGRSVIQFLLPAAIFISGIASLRGVATSRFLGNAWIATIGGMCYTIYLYHSFLISILAKLTLKLRARDMQLDLLIQFVLLSVGITAACAVLFAFLERPFMRRDWPAHLLRALRRAKT